MTETQELVLVESQTGYAADEARVLCVVADLTNAACRSTTTINLPASTTGQGLLEEISKSYNYKLGTFSLIYELPDDSQSNEIDMDTCLDTKLGALCSTNGIIKKRNRFNLTDKNGQSPIKIIEAPERDNKPDGYASDAPPPAPTYSSQPSASYSSSQHPTLAPSSGYSSFTSGSYASAVTKSDTGYVGLVNQAMTCYLNSLLQTLFMTPEFRNAVYRWGFDGTVEESAKSIPYQLQRLFLLLQTSCKRSVETTDITRSFGWDSSEAWQQHDVQELCRVMFDALEKKWQNTDQANLINELYQGKMKDYVRCLECGSESARTDSFLDIPLAIRPFGSNKSYENIIEALNAFVEPETLCGNNQYWCDKCAKKCDAHKGLKFTSFPYLLTLQLKRFDFDYVSLHRVKLNDRMSFPEILNLNHLIDKDGPPDDDLQLSVDGCSEVSDEGIDVDVGYVTSGASSCSESSITSQEAVTNDRNRKASRRKGPYEYELFSIMVHSGSAAGGHYYAYIKSFSDGNWYSFNDQHVSAITNDDIRKTYGGDTTGRGYYSSAFTSSTNAYMLMYRQVDKQRNNDFMTVDEFPPHLKRELDRMSNEEEEEKRRREMERSTCKIKVYAVHPQTLKKLDVRLEVHKNKTLAEATELAWKLFELDNVVTLDCVRLLKYDDSYENIECSFEGHETTPMGELLGGVKPTYFFDLFLETKLPSQTFEPIKAGGLTVKLYKVDLDEDTVTASVVMRAFPAQTVGEFKDAVAEVLGLGPGVRARCVLEKYASDLRPLLLDERTLKTEGFYKSNKVFVEWQVDEGDTVFAKSRLHRILDRFEHTVRLVITLPPVEYENSNGDEELEGRNGGEEVEEEEGIVGAGGRDEAASDQTDGGSKQPSAATSDIDERMKDLDEGLGESEGDDTGEGRRLQAPPSSADGWDDEEDAPLLGDGPSVGGEGGDFPSCIQKDVTAGGGGGVSTPWAALVADRLVSGSVGDGGAGLEAPSSSLSRGACGDVASPRELTGLQVTTTVTSTTIVREVRAAAPSPTRGDGDGECCNLDTNVPCVDDSDITAVIADDDTSPSTDKLSRAYQVVDDDGAAGGAAAECAPSTNRRRDADGDVMGASASASASTTVEENWDATGGDAEPDSAPEEDFRYFRPESLVENDQHQRVLQVQVDKRMSMRQLKVHLEQYMSTTSDNFKVFRVYSNNQEFECTRLTDTLSTYDNETRLSVKFGRALQKGEYKVKVYQLSINEAEFSKFVTEVILSKGMTVLDSKKLILSELRKQSRVTVPLNRCRLRKKNLKFPSTIYHDHLVYDVDIHLLTAWEFYVEILPSPEKASDKLTSVYVKRWHPSKYELGPFEEVILRDNTLTELKSQIASLNGIDEDAVEIAKPRGSFPYDMSVLEIHSDLDWNPQIANISYWPLSITDDGAVIFYRDKNEELMQLSEEKKAELQQRENVRMARSGSSTFYSPRKEKALKIYTDDLPAKSAG